VGQFLFESFKSDEAGACLQVMRSGRVVFRRTSDSRDGYTLGQAANKEWKVPAIVDGTDVTGRGHPDEIVSYWTGGAHCCLLHYVFELEPTFRMLATLAAEDDDMSHFAQLDGDGRYYYLSADWTFAYWPSSFAGSPSAAIVLRFVDEAKGGGYHLALDKMRQAEPTPAEWAKELRDAHATIADDALEQDSGATIWTPVLNLIYSGHPDAAWRFLDESWPANDKRKNEWLGDFCSILKISPYWPDLEATMANAPPACANAKPDETRRRSQ
jgi:hypothetical protein